MIIEVGKAYRTADGHKVMFESPADGQIISADVSPWEDSQTQIKSESKMDEGFAAFFKERHGYNYGDMNGMTFAGQMTDFIRAAGAYVDVVLNRAIKSVEPAPPAVGDTVTWTGDRQWIIAAADLGMWWLKSTDSRQRMTMTASEVVSATGFRVTKRAGER